MEEFVNFTISDTEDTQQPIEPQDWTSYPDLFTEKKEEPPMSIITFDGASLMEEEYVDPFASLTSKATNTKEEFLKKLKSRRQKLEEMAKSLSTQQLPSTKVHPWDLEMNCKESKIHWQPQVQAYCVEIPDFSQYPLALKEREYQWNTHFKLFETTTQSHLQAMQEKELARSMLSLFQFHLPEFLS
jgi:hypothetical protein